MSELDTFIYKLAFAVLLISCVRKQAFVPAFFMCLSFAINEIIFIKTISSWQGLEWWAMMESVNFGAFAILFGFRRKTPEIILSILFAVLCFYHQIMLIELQNHILTLKHNRIDLMTIVTALQVATVIYILTNGSANNGGKRVKSFILGSHNPIYRLFYIPSHKAFKK